MAQILIKRGRYLTGHSYATGLGYKFHWSAFEKEARRYQDNDIALAQQHAKQTGAKIVKVTNTKLELRMLGRIRMNERSQGK